MTGVIEVLRPGPLTTVQDLGRPGYGHLGVPPSGAADQASLRLANRLVGNPDGAAALEMTLGGAALAFHAPAWVALTGAPAPARVGGRATAGRGAAVNAPVRIERGEVLEVGTPPHGVRTYLAVRGGVDVPPVLGSRSTDLLSGLGPPALRAGALLPVGPTTGLPQMSVDLAPTPPGRDEPELRVAAGPRDDWFVEDALTTLADRPYTVTPASNRVGVRLEGPVLARAREGELPSEGIVTGAVQVPPNGQPIIFLNDHPTTGGYPVIGVVVAADLPLAGQLRPGARVRFRLVSRRALSGTGR